jgi:hypothetical protein
MPLFMSAHANFSKTGTIRKSFPKVLKAHRVGTCVAILLVMRLSETITIYLAAGAPFAVSYFLHQHAGVSRARLFFKAALSGLLWPLVALRIFFRREQADARRGQSEANSLQPHEARVDAARRSLMSALYTVREVAAGCELGAESEKLERNLYVLRDSVEKFVGLSNAFEVADTNAQPSERELELFRIAGRKGDDLVRAGVCVHRRNVMRLKEHHARARTELLHALAEIREAADSPRMAAGANALAARRLSIATLGLYGRAVDLLSLLEDESAAMSVAQLLNQECKRLRRLQAATKGNATEHETREDLCIAHTSRLSHAPSANETRLAQG